MKERGSKEKRQENIMKGTKANIEKAKNGKDKLGDKGKGYWVTLT